MIRFEDITPDMYDALNREIEESFEGGCSGNCNTCGGGCSSPKYPIYADALFAVASGKGGTGKSVMTALIATSLSAKGYKVGILDADINCGVQHHLFNLSGPIETKEIGGKRTMIPKQHKCGVSLLSYNMIEKELTKPTLLPSKDLSGVVSYLYTDAQWNGFDIILIDMPSGEGDVPLNLYTSLPVTGTIIVAEPGELAVVPTQRCINLCAMLMSKPVAFIENKALENVCTADNLYTIPDNCVVSSVGLSPEITMAACEGTIDEMAVPELDTVVGHLAFIAEEMKKRHQAFKLSK